MVTSNLLNHRGARDVTAEELLTIEAPPPTDTWFPVRHSHVLEAACGTLQGAGFEIKAWRLSLAADDTEFTP